MAVLMNDDLEKPKPWAYLATGLIAGILIGFVIVFTSYQTHEVKVF